MVAGNSRQIQGTAQFTAELLAQLRPLGLSPGCLRECKDASMIPLNSLNFGGGGGGMTPSRPMPIGGPPVQRFPGGGGGSFGPVPGPSPVGPAPPWGGMPPTAFGPTPSPGPVGPFDPSRGGGGGFGPSPGPMPVGPAPYQPMQPTGPQQGPFASPPFAQQLSPFGGRQMPLRSLM